VIYLVDDERELLESLDVLLKREFGAAKVRSTTEPEEARRWLEQERPEVMITDFRMPNYSGLDLLAFATQRWGSLPVILITAFASPEINDLTKLGTFKYLPKPFQPQQLISTVRSLTDVKRQGFDGFITVSMLADVIQLHALAGSTGALYIDTHEGSGSVWFSGGKISHAVTASGKGSSAFYDIMRWRGGNFRFEPSAPPETSITVSNNELLLEAYRLRDEALYAAQHQVIQGGSFSIAEDADELFFDTLNFPGAEDEEEATKPSASAAMPAVSDRSREAMERLSRLAGFLAGGTFHRQSGELLSGVRESGLKLSSARASLEAFVRAGVALLQVLRESSAEDAIITTSEQYHIIRPLAATPGVALYAIFERARVNLAFTRIALAELEKDLLSVHP
jgi:CheY-like chemotaxis protein